MYGRIKFIWEGASSNFLKKVTIYPKTIYPHNKCYNSLVPIFEYFNTPQTGTPRSCVNTINCICFYILNSLVKPLHL
jgi:hypothetical protein